eukprot:5198550-Alexandrium_andersonii.AAC.1
MLLAQERGHWGFPKGRPNDSEAPARATAIRGEATGEFTYSYVRRPYGTPPGTPQVRRVKTVTVFLAAGP